MSKNKLIICPKCGHVTEDIDFETKNYHGQIVPDFTSGWFEHNELGEMDGGSFEIAIMFAYDTSRHWTITDVDGCYDVAEEVKKHLDNIITRDL